MSFLLVEFSEELGVTKLAIELREWLAVVPLADDWVVVVLVIVRVLVVMQGGAHIVLPDRFPLNEMLLGFDLLLTEVDIAFLERNLLFL